MDYPSDFPEHLKRKVDGAIAKAEIDFIDSSANQANTPERGLLFRYIETVFFGFAEQCVQAGREGHWTGERIRKAFQEFLEVIIDRTFRDKDRGTKDSTSRFEFRTAAFNASRNWKRWRDIHEDLEAVFTAMMPAHDLNSKHTRVPHRGLDPKVMRDAYLSSFSEKIKIIDICWAAGQHYCDWKAWLRGRCKDGSSPDRAFRAILLSTKTPSEYRKQPRPKGWK